MKAKWIDEVYAIVGSEGFSRWISGLESARREFDKVQKRYEELLTQVNLLEFRAELAHRKAIDTLERANVLEDKSAELANESATLENESFEAVSRFEMQRDRTTKLWETLGGIDVKMDESSDSEKKRLARQREKLNEDYEREDQRKQKLWGEVERLWVRSIDCNLGLREIQQKAQIVRAEAERLFLRHEEEAGQALRLKAEAEAMAVERDRLERAVNEGLERAKQDFECLLREDFLYWVARETNKVVYCVPLIQDASHYALPLEPGKVYRCSPTQGIDELHELGEGGPPTDEEGGAGGPGADAGRGPVGGSEGKGAEAASDGAKSDVAKSDAAKADAAKADKAKASDDASAA